MGDINLAEGTVLAEEKDEKTKRFECKHSLGQSCWNVKERPRYLGSAAREVELQVIRGSCL